MLRGTFAPGTHAQTPAYLDNRLGETILPARQPHILYDASKRALDVAIAVFLLVLTLPLLLLAAVAILLSTGSNPLLGQRRVGLLGRESTLLKLRTMRTDDSEGEFAADNDRRVIKLPSDPRVTAVGRLLRRSSIDELPQLLNVIAGQMSLVGPRPALPVEFARYPLSWRRRVRVKPGLSGLWQVSGRSHLEPRRRVALDRLYIRRRSLSFDLLILLRTVPAVLSRRGAW